MIVRKQHKLHRIQQSARPHMVFKRTISGGMTNIIYSIVKPPKVFVVLF